MFVEAKIGGQGVNALLDYGATNNILKEKEARRLGISSKKEHGFFKAVNSKPTPIHDIARGVKVILGD